MKTCGKKRKLIVELALGALEPDEAHALETHIESCAECRDYLAEVSGLSAKLRAARNETGIETSEAFHQRVMRAIRKEEELSWWATMTNALRAARPGWRAAMAGLGGLALVVAALLWLAPRPTVPPPGPAASLARLSSVLEEELPPSVANYRIAANRSLEQLDELLTQQANRRVSAKPVYTASAKLSD